MSRDLGRDVPDLEKLYARKLWADFSYPSIPPVSIIQAVLLLATGWGSRQEHSALAQLEDPWALAGLLVTLCVCVCVCVWGFHSLIFFSLPFWFSLPFSFSTKFLAILSVFPFFPKGFRGSASRRNPCLFRGFPCCFPKRQGKEDQG